MNRIVAIFCAGITGWAALACVGSSRSTSSMPAPEQTTSVEALLPVSALAQDMILRQRVTIRWQGQEESFEAVLQKRGGTLLLLGLGPMNSVGFSLALDESGVRFENRSGRELPFAPERILADVQRVFYPWIEGVAPCTQCERRGSRLGFEVVERIGPNFLEERRFESARGATQTRIRVRFADWRDDGRVPGRAMLHNERMGYVLIVVTKGAEWLGESEDAD